MVNEYRIKYGIETSISMWSHWRARHNIPVRRRRADDMIPWRVLPRHTGLTPSRNLATISCLRAGVPVRPERRDVALRWEEWLKENNLVVHYDRDTPEGWWYVPREPTDDDIIRRPATTE
jgi:hypothetical protein